MRATVMHAAGDVRIEDVPDAAIVEPTDAVVRVTRACICGSDLLAVRVDGALRDRAVDGA
jgi:threonine dehydrogenase-like Zn-dependent dehydrogenase